MHILFIKRKNLGLPLSPFPYHIFINHILVCCNDMKFDSKKWVEKIHFFIHKWRLFSQNTAKKSRCWRKKIIIGKSAKKTEWTKFINYRECEHIPMELLKYRNQWSAGWQIGLVYHFKWLGHQHGLNIGKYSGFCGQPALPLDSCFYIPLFLKKNIHVKRQTLWNLNHTHSFNMHLWRCCCCRWWWWRQWISIYKL